MFFSQLHHKATVSVIINISIANYNLASKVATLKLNVTSSNSAYYKQINILNIK